jgi:urease accessory protein
MPSAINSDLSRGLKLLQLADSALPIGGLAHSFGLESMIEEQFLTVDGLFSYLEDLLQEALLVEAVFCRTAHACDETDVPTLNASLSALRLARESREASLSLGKRFIKLVATLDPSPKIQAAAAESELHFSIAFGYASGALGFRPDETVAAFLHQNVVACLSAAQRLLSLGQMQSSRIAWDLKPRIAGTVTRSAELDSHSVCSFAHLPELSSMRHPILSTRLFIS